MSDASLFGDTPQLFFADLFLVELLGLFAAMVLFMWLDRDGSVDREWIAAFVVLLALGVPLVVWVVLPFWRGRIDDPLWLVGIAIGVVIGVIMRFVSLRNIPSSGEEFAAPWMRRGFALWVAAVLFIPYLGEKMLPDPHATPSPANRCATVWSTKAAPRR